MKKTRILAFVLTVVMIFSALSVCASAAYTPETITNVNTKLAEDGGLLVYDTEFVGLDTSKRTGSKAQDSVATAGQALEYTGSANNWNVRDYYSNYNKETGKGINLNAKDDGNGDSALVWSSWSSELTNADKYDKNSGTGNAASYQGDDNNCFEVYTVADKEAYGSDAAKKVTGKDFTVSVDIKAPNGGLTANIPVFSFFDNFATSQIKFEPVYIKDTTLELCVGSTSGTVVGKLSTDAYTNITVNVRIIAPTNPGAYDAADFTTGTALTAAALAEKYGKVVYDVYVDGILVSKDNNPLSANTTVGDKKVKLQGLIGTTHRNDTTKVATGLSTDYRLTYLRVMNLNGATRTVAEQTASTYSGKEMLRLDNFRLYFSDECYTAYNNANTVNGYDLTIDNGVLGLNYYLNLPTYVLADENAKVVFTTPRGEVQETLVKDVMAEANGSYKFTATVSSVEMAENITMQIKSGETVYKIYKDGAGAESYGYSVKDYAEELLGDATYGDIAKAMLNYGAYAQLYFAAKSGNQAGTLANASCAYTTELDAVTIDVADPTQTGTGKKVAKLILDTTTSIVIYDAEGNKIGEQTGISSKNLDTAYEIDCGTAGKVTVSVLAIGEKVLASQSVRDEYKSLIKALKLFSDASEALA